MKRDMDLVRSILLKVEDEGTPKLQRVPQMEGFDRKTVIYHLQLLREAGLISAVDAGTMSGPDFLDLSLNWEGHEFLEKIRDPEIWRSTKAGAVKVGSWGIGMLGKIAEAAILAKLQALGLAAPH